MARTDETILADYGSTRGSATLRRLLMGRFSEEGIELPSEQLMLTGSGTQAVDLICRFLLRPGDTVLVDDPCYFNFRALLRAHQVKVVGVPLTPAGPDIASFGTILAAERPRLYLTNSALHNPTGATLSAQTAHRVLNDAAAHELIIVEDDIFADFEPEPSIRLAALDGFDRVIRIGSFSKTLSASARCGYIAARPDWIADLVDLQVATSFVGPSPIATELIATVLASGSYRKHMEELRRRLARARQRISDTLRSIDVEPWLMPRGGFYLWCRLPNGCDAAEVARTSLSENVVFAPGNVFSASQTAADFMRFNVAQCDDPVVMDVFDAPLAVARTLHDFATAALENGAAVPSARRLARLTSRRSVSIRAGRRRMPGSPGSFRAAPPWRRHGWAGSAGAFPRAGPASGRRRRPAG